MMQRQLSTEFRDQPSGHQHNPTTCKALDAIQWISLLQVVAHEALWRCEPHWRHWARWQHAQKTPGTEGHDRGKMPLSLEVPTWLPHCRETPASTRLDIEAGSDCTVSTPGSILAAVHGWIQQPLGDLPTVPLNCSKLSQLQLLRGLRLSGQRSLQIK